MNEIKLVKPSIEYTEQIWAYRTEFAQHNDELHGSAGLARAEDVTQWLTNIQKNSCEEMVMDGLVPATTFLVVRVVDNQLVGMINIRHRLNDFLLKSGGHIGYNVRPTARRKGYATAMLKLALIHCRQVLKLGKVLITCDKENVGSAKTILANGGRLENELSEAGRIMSRYWIDL